MARIKKLSGFGKRVIAIILCAAMLAAVFPLSSLVNVMAASEGALDGTVLKIDYDSTDGPSEDIAAWLDEKYSVDASNIGEITRIEITGSLDAAAYQILQYVYDQQTAGGKVNFTEAKVETSGILDGDDIGTYVKALNGVAFNFTLLDGATTSNLINLAGINISSVTVEAGATFKLQDGGPTIDSLMINGGELDLSALQDIHDIKNVTTLIIGTDSSIVFKESTTVKDVQTFLADNQIDHDGIILTDGENTYTQEDTPAITIDYVAEKLVGLESDAAYLINDDLYTSNSSGEININSDWFNASLNMIRVGRDAFHMDSVPASVSIPARPQSPDIGHKNTVGGDDNGVLTGLDNSMEYSLDDGKTWTPVEPSVTEIADLATGIYVVRIKAVSEKSFCSNPVSVTIHAGASADIMSVGEGPIVWGEETAQAITIRNDGSEAAYVDSITISGKGAECFEIEEGSHVIAPNTSISDWKVKPKASPSNPGEGTYPLTFTLTYHNDGVTPPPSASPSQQFSIEIIEAKLNEKDYTITGYSAVYDQKEHDAIKVEGALETDTVSYAETANGPWIDTLKVKDVLDSETYYARIKRDHHEPLVMSAEVAITPATPSIQFEDADEEGVISPIYYNNKGSFQYNATNTTGNSEGGKITYEIVEDQTEAAGAKIVDRNSSQVTYTGVGKITVRASINANGADTNYETGVTAEYTGHISYINDAPKVEFKPASPSNSSESYHWYNCSVTISPVSSSTERWSVMKTKTVPLPGSSEWGNSVSETNPGIYKDYTVSFMDADGNITDLIKIPDFAIDRDAPKASIAIQDSIWNQIGNTITFGLWKEGMHRLFYGDTQKVVVEAKDKLSGVKEVYYAAPTFSKNETPPNTKDGVAAASWEWSKIKDIKEDQVENVTDIKTISIGADEIFNTVIYVKVVDWAGNITYINSNGLIFDGLAPKANGESLVSPRTKTPYVVQGTDRPLYGQAEVENVEVEDGNNDKVVFFDVNVTETSDTVCQSGIQSIAYKVESSNDGVNYTQTYPEAAKPWEDIYLYDNTNTDENTNAIIYEWHSDVQDYVPIRVVASENNANYVKVTVCVKDNAGNEKTGISIIAIDLTAPKIEISYDNNDVKNEINGYGYYNAARTGTITFTERTENWNQDKAAACIAVGVEKANPEDTGKAYSISWEEPTSNKNKDTDLHIATITYTGEARYKLTVTNYTDEAGNGPGTPSVSAGTKNPYSFAIDKTTPTASIAIQDSIWDQIRNMVTFGLWKDLREDKDGSYKLFYQDEQKVVIKADDAFSGVKEVYYAAPTFSKNETPPNTEDGVAAASWEWSKIKDIKEDQVENVTDIKTISIGADEIFNTVIYVKVVDWAGNITYINSNGLIFDSLVPNADDTSIVVPKTETSHVVQGTKRPLYGLAEVNGNGGNVTFDVNVTETSDTVYQSGIRCVSYQVEMKDRDTDEYVITTEKTSLYKYNNTTKPLDSWETTIDVDASKNNANYVKVTVYVTDNADNETYGESIIAIDLTAPTMQLSYDNNDVKGKSFDGSRGYFDATRTATVTYTERSENWNQQAAEEAIEILAKDVADADIANPSYSITWQNELGAVPDEDRHIATIRYASSKDAGKDANYNVNIHYADEAGNQASDPAVAAGTQFPYVFTVDATPASDLKVTFSETVAGPFLETMTFGYYQGKVNVKISAKDDVSGIYKFLYSYIKEPGVSSVNAELLDQIVQAVELANSNITFDPAKHEFSTVFSIPREALVASNQFRGTVSFTAIDRCENSTDTQDPRVVVVDNIKPTGEVTFNAPIREANGISYYDGEITASIRIDEANFYPEDVIVEVNGSRVTPNNWTQSGDTWISSITLQEEGDYKISVNYTDRSGNAMTAFESNQKTIDKTAPVIDVSGVKHESANNGETIGFTLTVTDKNLDSADINPQMHAVVRQDGSFVTVPVDLGGVAKGINSRGESVYTYTITNLEADGYYTLAVAVTDYANHQVTTLNSADAADKTVTTDTVAFSVNRNGSAFSIQSKYKVKDGSDKNYVANLSDSPDSNGWYANLDGKYANYEVEVILTEINVDKVSVDTVSGLTLNDGSKANPITLDAANYKDNEQAQQGLGGWYKNTYTLGNENFGHDGNWSLNIVTTDTATNQNVNTKETYGATISFVVDRTMPVITSNVESGQIINATSFDVEINVTDANLIGDSIQVILDQGKSSKETLEVGKGVTALGNNKYSFTVEGLSRTVDVYAVDKAGNIAVAKDSEGNDLKDADGNNIGYQITGLTVSTNLFVRWYANTVLFWSSIGGVVLLAGVLFLFLFFRRRKGDNA